jgi:hypothetical protein
MACQMQVEAIFLTFCLVINVYFVSLHRNNISATKSLQRQKTYDQENEKINYY